MSVFNSLQKSQNAAETNSKICAGLTLPLQFKLQEQVKSRHAGLQSAKFEIPDAHYKGQNVWILKATGFNRGIGIHVFNRLEDLYRIIKEYSD